MSNITTDPGERAQRVRQIIAKQLGYPVEKVSDESDIFDDLGADSLDRIELVIDLEREFSVDIDDDSIERVQTVAQVIGVVERKVGRQ